MELLRQDQGMRRGRDTEGTPRSRQDDVTDRGTEEPTP